MTIDRDELRRPYDSPHCVGLITALSIAGKTAPIEPIRIETGDRLVVITSAGVVKSIRVTPPETAP